MLEAVSTGNCARITHTYLKSSSSEKRQSPCGQTAIETSLLQAACRHKYVESQRPRGMPLLGI